MSLTKGDFGIYIVIQKQRTIAAIQSSSIWKYLQISTIFRHAQREETVCYICEVSRVLILSATKELESTIVKT